MSVGTTAFTVNPVTLFLCQHVMPSLMLASSALACYSFEYRAWDYILFSLSNTWSVSCPIKLGGCSDHVEVVQITCRVWEWPENLTSAPACFGMASQEREQCLLALLTSIAWVKLLPFVPVEVKAEVGPCWHGRLQIVRSANCTVCCWYATKNNVKIKCKTTAYEYYCLREGSNRKVGCFRFFWYQLCNYFLLLCTMFWVS